MCDRACVCAYFRVCAFVSVLVCVCTCVCVGVRAYVCVCVRADGVKEKIHLDRPSMFM